MKSIQSIMSPIMTSAPSPLTRSPTMSVPILKSAIALNPPPAVRDAKWPVIIFLSVGLAVAVFLSAWSYDDEKRRHAVEFWTGGLGVLGVMAIGCGCILLFYGARVLDDTLRVVQADAAEIKASIAKMSDKVGSGVGVVSQILG